MKTNLQQHEKPHAVVLQRRTTEGCRMCRRVWRRSGGEFVFSPSCEQSRRTFKNELNHTAPPNLQDHHIPTHVQQTQRARRRGPLSQENQREVFGFLLDGVFGETIDHADVQCDDDGTADALSRRPMFAWI